MIWRLEYENAHGDVARLDIQRGAATPVEIIEGTENPFLLSYELEDKSKKGFIMSSFADISIYETATFNIDDLKTLDETALSVKWYINSVLEWTGFVVPDFFSRTIGEPAIVNLAASDRLSSLEDATLDGLGEYVKIKDLAIACLAKTGLSLPLISTVDFKAGTTNVMDVFALSDRLEDDKGKKISCYDVLRSILVLTNSTIRQRKGQWRIYNKIQHEAVAPTLNFDEVYQGAKRTIQPVFSSVGAFQEFGGGKRYPFNYDFQLATGWTAKNGFVFARENREVIGYTHSGSTLTPIYGDITDNYQLKNKNNISIFIPTDISGSPYLESQKKEVPFTVSRVGVNIVLNATAPRAKFVKPNPTPAVLFGAFINYAVVAESDSETLVLNNDGFFVPISNNKNNFQRVEFKYDEDSDIPSVIIKGNTVKGILDVNGSVSNYKVGVRIYGSGATVTTFIDSLSFSFYLEEDNGKGILYRTDQLGNFSKKSDPNTTIFGDFISSGLNGYFYPYAEDDKSILRSPSGLNPPLYKWTTATDPAAGELPILQHVTRQMSRMFGVAHNVLSAVIDAKTFDPLAIVTNCAGEKYVIVAATFDFLRSTVEVELQQIAYGSLLRRDFIFSYFGGGDGDGISSIGSVSGGGSSSGGGGGIPQTLDLIADELFISGGNSVDLGVYARKTWVETEATAYNSARLGGQLSSKYPRRDVDETISGSWNFTGRIRATNAAPRYEFYQTDVENACRWVLDGDVLQMQRLNYATGGFEGIPIIIDINAPSGSFRVNPNGNVGINHNNPTERLHVVGNGLFTGNLTAGGNVGTSNFVSQMLGWRVTPQGQADFRHIFTDELQAKAFTADISQALVGSDILTKSVAKLAQNWATTANGATSTIYVEELEGFPDFQVFAVGDRLLLRLFDRSGGGLLIKNIWATVASYVSTTKNVQRYTITVNSGGATGQTVYAGSMVLDYGTPGSGVIERTVLDQQGSPYSRVSTWVNNPWTPGNYTLHYQSGNLNGIANANGWGVYSENSFLTGKLLVGDLTKQGQFMEYANGQLNIKGKITVTGGNAATKADVDAVQVGGRNLLKWTNTGANWDKTAFDKETLIFTRETTGTTERFIYLANKTDLEKNTTYTLSAWVRTNGQVKGVDFFCYDKSVSNGHSKQDMDIGTEWQFITFTFTTNNADYSESSIRFDNNGSKTAGVNAILYIKKPKLERGNKATDWTPNPEDVPSALEYLAKAIQDGTTDIEGGLVSTNVLMVKDTNGAVRGGISGLKSDNIGFWAGGSYQGAIKNNANVIFRKDGSFSLAGGKIIGTSAGAATIEGGLITGVIESSNYNGEKGSRFDLHNGHLVIGDAIWMSGDTSEIHIVDRDTGLDSFKIGDFTLTPTDFAGAGVDVLLSSSSVSAVAADGSYQLNRTVYVSGSGALFTSAAVISNSLIAGGTYSFKSHLKVTLSPYNHIDTIPGYITGEGFDNRSGGIKIQLKNYNTVVWEKNILTIPASGVIPLLISTSFQAVSPQLQLIITIDGEFEYRQPDSSETRLCNTWASIERFDSSSRLVLQALLARMEFSTKGMQAVFSDSNYFRCDSTRIEGRGTQTFISPDGRYRLRVSNDGIEKSVNYGEVWTAL